MADIVVVEGQLIASVKTGDFIKTLIMIESITNGESIMSSLREARGGLEPGERYEVTFRKIPSPPPDPG